MQMNISKVVTNLQHIDALIHQLLRHQSLIV